MGTRPIKKKIILIIVNSVSIKKSWFSENYLGGSHVFGFLKNHHSLRIFTLSMRKLLGVTILPFHGMYDDVSCSPQYILGGLALPALGKVECHSPKNVLRLDERATHRHTFHEMEEW
jgi:hypothetical protein